MAKCNPGLLMRRIRYDMTWHYFSGQPGTPEHPQIEIRKVFPDATEFECFPIGDCWVFSTESELSPLPEAFKEISR